MFDNSDILKFMEELTGVVTGASLGEAVHGGAKSGILKALGKTVTKSLADLEKISARQAEKEATKDFNIFHKVGGKILATGSKLDEQLVKDAKAENIKLPFNVPLNNPVWNLMTNNVFKSIFTAQSFRDVLKEADKGMVEGLRGAIDSVHPQNVFRGEASDAARSFLQGEKEAVKKQSKELFDHAEKYINPDDAVGLDNLVSTMKDMKVRMADSPSSDQKFVLKRIVDIADKWNLLPQAEIKKIRAGGDEIGLTPHIIDEIEKHFTKNQPAISLERAISQRKAWDADINYDREIPGVKNWMNGLTGALEKDIGTSSNKAYLDNLNVAKSYYKQNMIDRVRSDIAQSLMNGQVPKEAISYMDSPNRIRELGKVLGDSDKAQEIFQSLKRAKLQEVLYDKAVDGSSIITDKGHIKYGALATSIKSKNFEMLHELLGEEQMKRVIRLSNIADGLSRSGREIGTGHSVTATVSEDFKQFQKGMDSVVGLMGVLAGYETYHMSGKSLAASALSALTVPTTIWGVSEFLSWSKTIQASIHYAEAIKNKKNIESAWKRLRNTAIDVVTHKPTHVFINDHIARTQNEDKQKNNLHKN